ncbi:copper-binding protein [Polaromonas sp. JS666]|uniref:copper-binding protein n=1 Tax=Polaromonas sp. (strain JS666 / ATCC BAA-500) TaxID=296591 RepID=UPI00087F88CE|nr:Cu and Ag efflux protein CusF [Polaromonas sp. JS666]
MKLTMKSFKTLLILATLFAGAAHAQSTMKPGGGAVPMGDAKKEATTPSAEMADGEIRKVDKEAKKITIKHGEIKNLEMPGMTMVFQVKDAAMLDAVKAGDKIRFRAESAGGAIVVTEIQPTQ